MKPSRPALLSALLLTTKALPALANGAFPDDLRVMTAHRDARHLVLATNFGLVVSSDDGATWDYVCEGAITGGAASVRLYDLGPTDTLYATWPEGLAHSDDGGCTWTSAGGSLAGKTVTDVFADPSDPERVFAIASGADRRFGIHVSHDRGSTFEGPLLAESSQLLSIESARTAKDVLLSTSFGVEPPDTGATASLLRSTDGGASWTKTRIDALPTARARILSIDPEDASLAFLRLTTSETAVDHLGIAHEGTVMVESGLQIGGLMGGFARGSDGTLYVGSLDGKLWTRTAGGSDWTSQPGPRFRCLAERDGMLYGCGSDTVDGYALAVSRDKGASWEPKLSFSRIRGPLACPQVQAACAADWETLRVTLGAESNGGPDAGSDSGPVPDAGAPVTTPPFNEAHDCGCAGSEAGILALALALLRPFRRRAGRA